MMIITEKSLQNTIVAKNKESYYMIQETTKSATMQSIAQAAKLTGLSQHLIRKLCSRNLIPCMRSGKKYNINVIALMEILNNPEQLEQLSATLEKSC